MAFVSVKAEAEVKQEEAWDDHSHRQQQQQHQPVVKLEEDQDHIKQEEVNIVDFDMVPGAEAASQPWPGR